MSKNANILAQEITYQAYCASLIASQQHKKPYHDLLQACIKQNHALRHLYQTIGETQQEKQLLADFYHLTGFLRPPPVQTNHLKETIFAYTACFDFWRRAWGRTQRLLALHPNLFSPMIDYSQALLRWVNAIFFLPKLLLMSYTLIQKSFSHDLSHLKRWLMLDGRIFNLLNDALLLTAGMLIFFYTQQALLTIHINVAVQWLEFLISSSNLLHAEKVFATLTLPQHASPMLSKQFSLCMTASRAKLILPFIARGFLACLSLALLPSVAALHPLIPFISAFFSLILVTIRAPSLRGYFIPTPPKHDVLTFFKPQQEEATYKEFTHETASFTAT